MTAFWELSTTEHRITHYWHVDQPILRADNYALCLGILPTILDNAGLLPSTRDRSMPSLYVNTIFYENAHHIYYPSRVVKEDRGEWTATPSRLRQTSLQIQGSEDFLFLYQPVVKNRCSQLFSG